MLRPAGAQEPPHSRLLPPRWAPLSFVAGSRQYQPGFGMAARQYFQISSRQFTKILVRSPPAHHRQRWRYALPPCLMGAQLRVGHAGALPAAMDCDQCWLAKLTCAFLQDALSPS